LKNAFNLIYFQNFLSILKSLLK